MPKTFFLATAMTVGLLFSPGSTLAATTKRVVILNNYMFMPRTLTVKPGTKVIWKHRQPDRLHDVDSDNGNSFSSPDLHYGDTFSHTFTKAGRFPYHCTFHGARGGVGMAGVIIVKN